MTFDFETLTDLAEEVYTANKAKGFWDKERNTGEMLMLVTSELGEAMEALRKNKFANLQACLEDGQTKESFEKNIKDTFEDELADAIIRLLDMAGGLQIDIGYHVLLKLSYNKTREKLHGKSF